jgi:hypothetical protein
MQHNNLQYCDYYAWVFIPYTYYFFAAGFVMLMVLAVTKVEAVNETVKEHKFTLFIN